MFPIILNNTLAKVAILTSCLAALLSSAVNASPIISINGDKGSSLEWEKIDDNTLGYTIDSSNLGNYLFSQVFTPFLSQSDRELITVNADNGWSCVTNSNYYVCDAPSGNTGTGLSLTDLFSATFSLPQEYVFGDFKESKDFTASTDGSDFELFSSFAPTILDASETSVSAPATSCLLLGGLGLLAYIRRERLELHR